ncbi:hypothetical protein BH11CYA1_BH11CYA1_26150 [soil metagenome]
MGSDSVSRSVVRDCFGNGDERTSNSFENQQFNNGRDLVSQAYSDNSLLRDRESGPQRFERRVTPDFSQLDLQKQLNRDGSEITFNEYSQVTAIRDAADRRFEFKYDHKSGELNQVKNEYGTWKRHKHSDEWKSDNGSKWHGEIEVNARGYSYTNYDPQAGRGDRTIYRPDGSKAVEYLGPEREVVSSRREDRNGNVRQDEYRDGKVSYTFNDGRRVSRDTNNNSLLAFDRDGNLSSMRDAAGKRFSFGDYDDQGRPQRISDEQGSWTRHGREQWVNSESGKSRYGQIDVDKSGSFSFTEAGTGSGRQVTHTRDGQNIVRDHGVITTTDKDGIKVKTFIDGTKIDGNNNEDDTKAGIKFKVVKGVTTAGVLNFSGADSHTKVEVVHGKDDIHAAIHSQPDSAVRAMQEGRVVYSFNHNDKNNRAGLANDMLGATDLAMLDRYRSSNPNQDIVVMACYDQQAHGTRYQIYGGLELASTKPGDTIKAGEVIGRAGDQGYTYAARRQRLAGKPVELMVQGQRF